MRSLLRSLQDGSQALSYGLGTLAIVLALSVATTGMPLAELLNDGLRVLGGMFLALLAMLTLAALYCWVRMLRLPVGAQQARVWLEGGLHAAAGVATLALTCTLLGIGLGIGELSGSSLTPDSVQQVIGELTGRFSMAFATTVVGLPVSALLRALLSITFAARDPSAGVASKGSRSCGS